MKKELRKILINMLILAIVILAQKNAADMTNHHHLVIPVKFLQAQINAVFKIPTSQAVITVKWILVDKLAVLIILLFQAAINAW